MFHIRKPVDTINGLSKLNTVSINGLFSISLEDILNKGILTLSFKKIALGISKGVAKKPSQAFR